MASRLKRSNCTKRFFFFEKQLIKFSCTYWPLSLHKIFNKFLGLIQSYEDVAFSGPKWPICHEQFFFGTNHYYYFHLPISPFHCAKFKKILTADPELWGCDILGPKMIHLLQKWPISPNKNFLRTPVNEPCFFHSCLSTYQKSKSDINLLVKYWRLKNTEISLAESHFWL